MTDDLKKVIEELSNKKEETKCCECKNCKCEEKKGTSFDGTNGFSGIPYYKQDDNFWVMSLLMLVLLDFPKVEKEKQPVINIYIGGE